MRLSLITFPAGGVDGVLIGRLDGVLIGRLDDGIVSFSFILCSIAIIDIAIITATMIAIVITFFIMIILVF